MKTNISDTANLMSSFLDKAIDSIKKDFEKEITEYTDKYFEVKRKEFIAKLMGVLNGLRVDFTQALGSPAVEMRIVVEMK